MTITAAETQSLTAEATAVLAAMPGVSYAQFLAEAPEVSGIVAVVADQAARARLGVEAEETGLLAVAVAPYGLRARDVRAAFQSGRTAVSPLRQALAALLEDELGLDVERTSPGAAGAGFTLTPESEDALTAWMRAHLTLRAWATQDASVLADVADQVNADLAPALALDGVAAPSAHLRERLAAMTAAARRSATI